MDPCKSPALSSRTSRRTPCSGLSCPGIGCGSTKYRSLSTTAVRSKPKTYNTKPASFTERQRPVRAVRRYAQSAAARPAGGSPPRGRAEPFRFFTGSSATPERRFTGAAGGSHSVEPSPKTSELMAEFIVDWPAPCRRRRPGDRALPGRTVSQGPGPDPAAAGDGRPAVRGDGQSRRAAGEETGGG